MSKADLPANLVIVDHPLVLHKLTLMRDKHTPSAVFRQLLREISLLLAYEVSRDLPMTTQTIETPLAEMEAPILKGKKLVIVSILRAGNGLLEGMLDLMPSARVGHIGIYRNPETLQPVEYYMKVPEDIAERRVIVVDPMLATGNSVSAAIQRLKDKGAKDIKLVCLSRRPRASSTSMPIIPMSRSSPPRSIASSTATAISCRVWAMPAIACSGRNSIGPKSCRLFG